MNFIIGGFLLITAWIIRRDVAQRDGLSRGIWIPTIWLGVLASRPLSYWVGFSGGVDSLEGSPVDRAFFLSLIFAAWVVLSKRAVNWNYIFARSWPILFYYGYFLLSVMWSDSPIPSFKRWFKDFGNVSLALVILTEVDPLQAIRAVVVRCAYLLLPLSILLIRYVPSMGRNYNVHSGDMEAVGVSVQKNSLGVLVIVSCLVLVWDWLERRDPGAKPQDKILRLMPPYILAVGAWLLHICDSKTSILCLALGIAIVLSQKLAAVRRMAYMVVPWIVLAGGSWYLFDSLFNITERLVLSLGRDMTFTGRTAVWAELLALNTDPIIGIGFCSFWDNQRYIAGLSDGIGASAHNGYLETYLDGGWVGIFFLSVLLLGTLFRISGTLRDPSRFHFFRLAVVLVIMIASFSESHYGRMGSLWFLFLTVALSTCLPPPMVEATSADGDQAEDEAPHVSVHA